MLEAFVDQAAGIALGFGIGFALRWALKGIPALIDKYLGSFLDKALDIRNPEDKELVLALVKWAEAKIPDRGQGVAKYDLVAEKLVSFLPIMARHQDRISRLIEAAVAQIDEELKERLPKKEV